jgi:hypothetical protein
MKRFLLLLFLVGCKTRYVPVTNAMPEVKEQIAAIVRDCPEIPKEKVAALNKAVAKVDEQITEADLLIAQSQDTVLICKTKLAVTNNWLYFFQITTFAAVIFLVRS